MDYFHLMISMKNKDQIKPDFSQQKAHAPQKSAYFLKKRYNRVYTLQISHLLTSYTQYMHHLNHDDVQEVQLMPLPNQKTV